MVPGHLVHHNRSPINWSLWTNWLGTICPGRPNFWGPFVHGDRIGWGPINWGPVVGDQMSRDHMCLGPNVSQSFIYRWCLHFPGLSGLPDSSKIKHNIFQGQAKLVLRKWYVVFDLTLKCSTWMQKSGK